SRDDAVCWDDDRHGRREACLEGSDGAIAQQGSGIGRVRAAGLKAVIGANGIVVGVGVIGERRVADAEARANDGIVSSAIGETRSWSEVGVAGLHAKIGW